MSIAEKLVTIAENQPKVYEAGKQAEYDRFWDAFQQNGNRTDYYYTFVGYGWTKETFKPKYNIKGTRFHSAFAFMPYLKGSLIDVFNECGVALDTSKATNLTSMFQYSSGLTEIPHIDLSSNTSSVGNLFYSCTSLARIEKVTYTESSSCYHNYAYANCISLTDIEFAGVVAGDINFQWSPLLTTASVQSIIDHLKDLTGATTQTLTLHADVGAKLTDEQKATITAKNWTLAY